jgi:hypothetical protein
MCWRKDISLNLDSENLIVICKSRRIHISNSDRILWTSKGFHDMAHIPENRNQMISILHNETGVAIPVEIHKTRNATTGIVRKNKSYLKNWRIDRSFNWNFQFHSKITVHYRNVNHIFISKCTITMCSYYFNRAWKSSRQTTIPTISSGYLIEYFRVHRLFSMSLRGPNRRHPPQVNPDRG